MSTQDHDNEGFILPSYNNPHIKFAFFAEGKQDQVVEALHRAAEQLNSRKMKSYNSPVSTPAVIRWFRQ